MIANDNFLHSLYRWRTNSEKMLSRSFAELGGLGKPPYGKRPAFGRR